MDPTVLLIFAVVYLGMLVGGIPGLALDRSGVALLGAIALVATRKVTVGQAWNAVDVPTIALLLGLMVVSAQFRLGGFYARVSRWLADHERAPSLLLALLIGVVGLLSALLANDIVCLAMTPIIAAGCARRGRDPVTFSDPFGLCTDSKGNQLPPAQCTDVSAEQGRAVYQQAKESGSWTYSRQCHDQSGKKGDCTDYVENAMRKAGLPSLGTRDNNGAVRTSGDYGYAASPDFRTVQKNDLRTGDILVQAGHAGIFTGRYENGNPVVLQNGVHGAGEMEMDNAVAYRRLIPINQ